MSNRRPIFENVQFLNESNKKNDKLSPLTILKVLAQLPVAIVKSNTEIKRMKKEMEQKQEEFKSDITKAKPIVDNICTKANQFVKSHNIKNSKITQDTISKTDYTKCITIEDLSDDDYFNLESDFEKFAEDIIAFLKSKGFNYADFHGNHTILYANDNKNIPNVEIGMSIESTPGNGCYIAISCYATA